MTLFSIMMSSILQPIYSRMTCHSGSNPTRLSIDLLVHLIIQISSLLEITSPLRFAFFRINSSLVLQERNIPSMSSIKEGSLNMNNLLSEIDY